MYLWPLSGSMRGMHSKFGAFTSPGMKMLTHGMQEGRAWACDNQVFTGKFNEERFFRYLVRASELKDTCLFVVSPDVVGDAEATLERFSSYSGRIKELGLPVALAAQNGLECDDHGFCLEWTPDETDWMGDQEMEECDDWAYWELDQRYMAENYITWKKLDALFIGGTDDWRYSEKCARLVRAALGAGLWVHVGRVNSIEKLHYWEMLGANSCDGTFPIYAPRQAKERLTRALQQPAMVLW